MNKTFKWSSLCVLLFASAAISSFAVEISLDNFKVEGTKSSSAIGYVDIETVFKAHPLAKRLLDEFNTEADKRSKEIDESRKGISDMQAAVISSGTLIIQAKIEMDSLKLNYAAQQSQPPAPVIISTDTADAVPVVSTETAKPLIDQAMITAKETELKSKESDIERMKQEIEKKKLDLSKLIAKHKKELADLEEKNTNAVLADLYAILEKVTIEDDLSMIVDKSDVLFGHPAQNYTDKVIERLRGR